MEWFPNSSQGLSCHITDAVELSITGSRISVALLFLCCYIAVSLLLLHSVASLLLHGLQQQTRLL